MSRTVQLLEEAFGSAPFTTAQAASVGVSRGMLSRAREAGSIVRLARAVYRLAGVEDNTRADHLDALDAVLLKHPTAVAAGVSSAAAWGLPCPDPWGDWRNLPVTVWSPRRLSLPKGATQLRGLLDRGAQPLGGRPVTDLVATARDVARQLPTPEALIVMDAVARRLAGTNDKRRLIDPRLRERVRHRLAVDLPPAPGTRSLKRAAQWADPAADSAPESYFRGHLLAAGLPAPIVNQPLTGASGKTYWIDLYWPSAARAVEIDGKEKYTEPGAVYQEKIREDDLRAAGVYLLRFTAADVFAHAPALARKLKAH